MTGGRSHGAGPAVDRLLAAVESRDLRRVAASVTADASWQNVPHPPAVGRDAVVAMLAGILGWSDEVRWDVLAVAARDATVWCERVDRFWIAGVEHAVRCCGVFTLDAPTGLVSSVRDYVDLGEWRARITPVYETMAKRDPAAVVARHLAAVARRDPVAMAADYALDARLERPGAAFSGWAEIAGYFDTVPARLDGRTIEFGPLDTPDHAAGDSVTVRWTVRRDGGPVTTGADRYRVTAGRIAHQTVTLDGPDL